MKPRFKLKSSNKTLASYDGSALIGQCFDIINVEVVVEGSGYRYRKASKPRM